MSDNRQIVYLTNHCFVGNTCTKPFSTPRTFRDHLRDIHGYAFPDNLKSTRRYNNKMYLYSRYRPINGDSLVKEKFACPCCLDHYDVLNDLANHFRVMHNVYLPSQQQQCNHDTAGGTVSANEDGSGFPGSVTIEEAIPRSDTQKRPHDETLNVDGITFSLPDHDRMLVDHFDVSKAFFDFQSSLKDKKWKLSLEQNIHLSLASSSILLITPNKYPDDLQQFITIDQWTATSNKLHDRYDIKRIPMPFETVNRMLGVTEDLMNKTINRVEAYAMLTKLPVNAHEHKFAKALGGLILKLLPVPMDEDINEAELCSRFIDPFLTGIFDDPDEGICLRWTNDATLEAKTCTDFTTNRPDLCITKCCGVRWKSSLGYGEAKPAAREHDHYVLCKDLLKVGVFCKHALDNQLMQGVLGIQIIGRTIRFYLLTLPANGLYVMLELETIKIPDSLQSLPNFVPEIPNVLKVLDVFHRICVPVNDVASIKDHRTSTMSFQKFDQLFTPSKNCKKPCHLKVRHN